MFGYWLKQRCKQSDEAINAYFQTEWTKPLTNHIQYLRNPTQYRKMKQFEEEVRQRAAAKFRK